MEPTGRFIFISYSNKDVVYVEKLIETLKSEGFNPWVDMEGLAAGITWRRRLHKQVNDCDAYLLIVSRNSYASQWVQEELDLAQKLNKPIFPLRLDNTEPFFGIRRLHYENVRGGKMPSEAFYKQLAAVTPRQKKTRRRNRTDKAKKQVMEGTAELLSYYGEELSIKGKDLLATASKKSSEVYKLVLNSDAVKKLSARVKKNTISEEKTAVPKKKKTTTPKKSKPARKKKK